MAILEAANDVMAGQPPAAVMPEVARRAGVSQATLYRHFSNRYALISALVAHQVQRLEALAAALTDHPETFRPLLRAVLHAQVAMRPLVRLTQHLDPATRDRYHQRVIAALSAPLRQAQTHGYVRGDITPDDLALLFLMVQGVTEATDDASAAYTAAERSIELALDGVFRPET
ncbi:TetR/AcrR family transcriptional regulator [Planosporangium flavigriseum]|uniref:HTH tetR-type domain-containing protein n=1 Tax=Planosporangium flavigriseum TaxID=373681 RepID=A0A8J3LUE0_9ACTN|nr:TetR/AcrR family transcriptional regulator [Planosporangium flavigriseum]GIG73465.1 hypothetical protein Pfl04_18690 [Planosporangium flavigriseum]